MKTTMLVIVFLFLIQFSNSVKAQNVRQGPQEEKLFEQKANFNKLAVEGKYDEAIAGYTNVLKTDPNDADSYFERGILFSMQHKDDAAIKDFIKSIGLNPPEPLADAALAALMSVYVTKKDYDQAFLYINKRIELNPMDSSVYYLRGSVYLQRGDFDQAIADENKGLEIYSDQDMMLTPEAKKLKQTAFYLLRAKAYLGKKEYDKSWNDIHKAESLGGDMFLRKNNAQFFEDLKKASGRDN